jgi:hypothetical protein
MFPFSTHKSITFTRTVQQYYKVKIMGYHAEYYVFCYTKLRISYIDTVYVGMYVSMSIPKIS